MNLKIILGVIALLTAIFTAATAYWKSGTSKESSGAKIENSTITTECSPNISNIKANGSITIENSGCNKK